MQRPVTAENTTVLTGDNLSPYLGKATNLASSFWFLYLQSCNYSTDLP
jgi:hypothetical protein